MSLERRWFLRPAAVVACAFALLGIAGADAQTYPTRPITMIGPYAAGGPTDTIARIMAEGMRPSLGQADEGRDGRPDPFDGARGGLDLLDVDAGRKVVRHADRPSRAAEVGTGRACTGHPAATTGERTAEGAGRAARSGTGGGPIGCPRAACGRSLDLRG